MTPSPYPNYRDSGLAWLRVIPTHWQVQRNKHILCEVDDRSTDGSEELLTVSQYTGVTKRRENQDSESALLTRASDLTGYKRVKSEDIVINIMLAWNGSLGRSSQEGIVSPAYCVFRSKPLAHVDSRYLHYLYRTPLLTGLFKTESTGVVDSRLRLYPDAFLSLSTPVPPLDEQAAIVKYLAHVDRKIDRFIRSKRRMIELLNEQKQAIIHQAVTKGLDPSVPMKDSGVEWLGEIPAHWETRPLSTYLSYLSYGFTNPMPTTDAGPVMLTAADIGEGRINYHTARHTSEEAYLNLLTPKSRPELGDILITKDGTLGRTAVVDRENLCINQSVGVMRPRVDLIDTRFLEALLRSAPYQLRMQFEAGGTTIKHIYISRLAKMAISAPPTLSEQIQLTTHMASVQIRFSKLVSGVDREIQLVQEFRQRLVADVVTGKFNVMDLATTFDSDPVQESLEMFIAGGHDDGVEEFSQIVGNDE